MFTVLAPGDYPEVEYLREVPRKKDRLDILIGLSTSCQAMGERVNICLHACSTVLLIQISTLRRSIVP
jgi:hypothetical protein